MSNDNKFPQIKKSIQSFIEDEEGNIPASKLLTIGTLVLLLGTLLSVDVFAKHGSHKSHGSRGSHSSSSYHRSHGSHSNSHSSHASFHGSHASHASHSNTASHSNANYSIGGDYGTPVAPSAYSIQPPPVTQFLAQNIQTSKEMKDISAAMLSMQVPQPTPNFSAETPAPLQSIPITPSDIDVKPKK